ncbi:MULTISPECIES: Fic family protein [Nocardia]|uniref:Fic family protein n=1 Tax=Nocardia TaxID=1817 RepID=UPI0019154F72
MAANAVGRGESITEDVLLEIHRRLLAGTRLAEHGGSLRDVQNWIGGSSFNPCSAAFVPPPPELVPELMEDLISFCNSDDLPAVAQAAIAHAQFETIHPFIDGNGRTGRALIHLILRRRRRGRTRRRACVADSRHVERQLHRRSDSLSARGCARFRSGY